MAVINCDDACLLAIDQTQLLEIYESLNTRIRTDLQADYDCKKINGATFADTWAKMMSPAIGHIMTAMVSLATKETAADRAVKASTVDRNDCACENETTTTDSKVALNLAQEAKLACDCANATAIKDADVILKGYQGSLYVRQAKGFDDNANQKLFDSQLSAWSMVFADTDLDTVTAVLNETNMISSFNRVTGSL